MCQNIFSPLLGQLEGFSDISMRIYVLSFLNVVSILVSEGFEKLAKITENR